jgi:RNA polymerase subunit RPABC4/transcription elongation factor Spt4
MVEEEKIYCLSCGRVIKRDAKFCSYCGANLRGYEPITPSGQEATRLCTTCGKIYSSTSLLCPYCGSYPTGNGHQTGSSYESYPMHQEQPLGSIKYIAYLVALLIPILGIIWGIVWVLDKDKEKRAAGRITLMIGVWTFFLGLICLLWIAFPF